VSSAPRSTAARGAAAPPHDPPSAGPLTFTRLKWTSFTHSCVYIALLICAFAAGNPEPLTFVLGLAHGLLWIFMSLVCLTAARLRIVSLRLAVAVAVLGGIGPFFGSYEFIREQRLHDREPSR
jgi:type IV secretory pathway VirB6-like protein